MEIPLTTFGDLTIPFLEDPSFSPTTVLKWRDSLTNVNKSLGDATIPRADYWNYHRLASSSSSSLESGQSFTCQPQACSAGDYRGWGLQMPSVGACDLDPERWGDHFCTDCLEVFGAISPQVLAGLLCSRSVALWVIECSLQGVCPGLAIWVRGRKRGKIFSLLAGNGCLLSLEPQGWNSAHSPAGNQPTDFGELPHQSVGLVAWPPPVGTEPSVTNEERAGNRPFLCSPSARWDS